MHDYLPFVLIGMTTGSVYGLMSVGLVLTYRTSGIYNLAHGSIAALAITLFSIFFGAHGFPLWLSLVICVPLLGFVLGSLLERLARRLTSATAAHKVVATVGLLLVVDWLAPTISRVVLQKLWVPNLAALFARGLIGRFGFGPLTWLPTGTSTMWDVVIGYDQIVIMAVALVATIALWLLLRVTRLGIAMRAVVDNPELAELTGASPSRVRRWAWTIGASYACLAGLLLSNRVGTNSTILTPLVVQATGAAAFGAFGSIPLAYIGGIALGVASAIGTKSLHGNRVIEGLPVAMPFLFLFVALLVVPKRRLLETARTLPGTIRRDLATRVPRSVRVLAILALYAGLLVVPPLGLDLQPWMRVLSFVVLCLGLGLLVRTSGQISLCHYAFAAVGAAAFHGYAASAGVPWAVALLLAGLTAVPVGALIAVPAIRLSGLFLALATFAFAYGMQYLLYGASFMFKVQLSMPRPAIAQTEERFYYVLLLCVTLCVAFVIALQRSRLGRLLAALSDSPTALETHGTTVNVTRLLVFCISAFLAGVGGALLGCSVYFVGDSRFSAFASLTLLTVVMVAPGRRPWYAFPAAGGLAVMTRDIPLSDVNWSRWHLGFLTDYLGFGNLNLTSQLFVGALAIGVAVSAYPPTRRSVFSRLLRRSAARTVTDARPEPALRLAAAASGELPALHRPVRAEDAGLVVDRLVVRYGALVAVDDLSLQAPMARVTGLIGPNGAGKSTTFDACSGLLRPSQGTVQLHGRDVSHSGPAVRARMGLGRTFQRVQLWGSLSVGDNVALGREGGMAGGDPLRQVVSRAGERGEVRGAADWAMEVCGVGHLRSLAVAGLTTSERRLVELARCLASSADLLLLDEPSSGLDHAETEAFGRILQDVVERHRIGVLLVEHDMSLVMDVCQHIYVLDVGKLIAEGSPDQVRASDAVRAAYLGVDGAAVAG